MFGENAAMMEPYVIKIEKACVFLSFKKSERHAPVDLYIVYIWLNLLYLELSNKSKAQEVYIIERR
jgi:hypothetical protein